MHHGTSIHKNSLGAVNSKRIINDIKLLQILLHGGRKPKVMAVNATFNNISVILWQSVLLVEEPGGPEKTTNLPQVTDKLL
jgi:hypothetical protein